MTLIRESRSVRKTKAKVKPKHKCKPPSFLATTGWQPEFGSGAVWRCEMCRRQFVSMGWTWRPKVFRVNPNAESLPLDAWLFIGLVGAVFVSVYVWMWTI